MHTKLPYRVGGRRDNAALISTSTHNHRFVPQTRVEEFFNRDEEGIHVNMEDDAFRVHEDNHMLNLP